MPASKVMRDIHDAQPQTPSTAAPPTKPSRPISERSTTTAISPLQPSTTKPKMDKAGLRNERLKQLASFSGDAVTSAPESVSGLPNAPGQLGESATSSKRPNTRPNAQKGPAYNKRKLARTQQHHSATGRAVHDEQQQKAEMFTGLGGPALIACSQKIEERVKEAAANNMTSKEKFYWYTKHLAMLAAPCSDTVARAA